MKEKKIQQKTKKKFFSEERKKRILPSAALSLFFPFMVFFVAPFEIFASNVKEFYFSAGAFLPYQFYSALIFVALTFCLLFFLPRCVYEILYPILLGSFLMTFVQSNYLNGGLETLNGDTADGFSAWTYVWNTAVWVIVLGGVVFLYKYFKKHDLTKTIALILTFTLAVPQALSFGVLAMTTDGVFASPIDRKFEGDELGNPRFLTNKNLTSFAEDKNVIVFCVDKMDGKFYTEPAMQKYPETFAKFEGFTYYEDAISLYGNTFPSVAYFLTNTEYDNGDGDEWLAKVYNDNQTIERLHEEGYKINLFAEYYYDYRDGRELPDYIENSIEAERDSLWVSYRKPWGLSRNLTLMSLYRTLPYALKGISGNVDANVCNSYARYHSNDLGDYVEYNYDTDKVYRQFQEKVNEFSMQGEKNFSFIHLNGCHAAGLDKNFKKSKKEKNNFVLSARNSMELIASYLEGMKRQSPEAYKNATIVILGDHGKVKNIFSDFDRSMLTSMFVKPSGVDSGELKFSSAPVSHENLWPTIFESEGISYDKTAFAPSVFTIERMDPSLWDAFKRKFIWNCRNLSKTAYTSITYEIIGSARDFDHWSVVKREYFNHPLFAN